MKKNKLLAIMVAAVTLISTVPVYANTQPPAEVTATSTDEKYPLSHLADWFVVDTFGQLNWKWDSDYLWLGQGMEAGPTIRNYLIDSAVRDGKPEYLALPVTNDMLVVAKLAGVPLTGYEDLANAEEILKVEAEVRTFLNSFDWKNASDMEKAIQVANRITKADYETNEESDSKGNWNKFITTYACLVNGKANCSGYGSASTLLSFCIGLPSSSVVMIGANHTYPVYLVDGVWLAYEPTSKSNTFDIADYEKDITKFADGKTFPGLFAEYCIRSGYVAPTDIWDKFPGMVSSTRTITSTEDYTVQYVVFR